MNQFEKVKNSVKENAKEFYDENQEKASSMYDDLKNKAEATSHQVKETVSDLYEEGKKKVTQAEEVLCDYSDSLVKTIKDKPLTAVLIAAGVGFLLSKTFKK